MEFTHIFVIILRICCGIITGLIPSLHINMVSSLILVNITYLMKITDNIALAIFIITNILSFIALISATSLAILAIKQNIKRIHLMNVLIIPIIINLL